LKDSLLPGRATARRDVNVDHDLRRESRGSRDQGKKARVLLVAPVRHIARRLQRWWTGIRKPTISIPTAGPGDVEKFFQLTPGNRWGFNVSVNETGYPSTSGFETSAVTGTKTISGYSTVVLSHSGQDNAEEYY